MWQCKLQVIYKITVRMVHYRVQLVRMLTFWCRRKVALDDIIYCSGLGPTFCSNRFIKLAIGIDYTV